MPGEFGPYLEEMGIKPPIQEINQTNPTNMTEKQEKIQAERENFETRMYGEAEKLAEKMGANDEKFIDQLKNDLIEDYAHEEYARREKRPGVSPSIYESGEGSEVVEDLIIEKVLSGLDSLTGINNRSSLDQQVERRRKEVKTQGEFSMIMIDIDKFKNVNDTYGHQGGDYVLREVAKTLKEGMRHGDLLARYGGEEIVVIAPNANGDVAGFAERLRKKIENTKFNYNGQDIKVTISAGVSPYEEDFEEMKKISDTGLYLAKGEGKKLTEDIKVEHGHEGEQTRNQIWYFDKITNEYRKK